MTYRLALFHPKWLVLELLCNHSACNAVAGVPRGIGLHVIGLSVNHNRGPAITEQGVAVVAHIHGLVHECLLGGATLCNGEIRHVPSVRALWILQSMFLVVRIEVRACGLEVRHVASWILMNMDSMLAGRKIIKIESDLHTLLLRRQGCGAHTLAIPILQMDNFLAAFGRAYQRDCADGY